MKTLSFTVTLSILLALLPSAHAELIANLPDDTNHAVSMSAGLDSSVAMGLGYTYRLKTELWKHDLLLTGRLTLPSGDASLSDNSVHLGFRTTALAHGNFRLQVSAGPLIINQKTKLYSARALGAHATLLPGYQSSRWGLMAELGYEKIFATRLKHSSLYTERFYADAKDGWYRTTAGTLRLGMRGGVRFGNVQLSARAGLISTEGRKPHIPPVYAGLGASYAF